MGEVNLIRVSPDELLIIHANGDGTAILEHFQRRDAVKLPAEAVAALFEIGTELAVVVDLAVEGDPDGFVFVGDGLVAAGEVDDA